MADTGKTTLTSLTITDEVDALSSPSVSIAVNAADPDGIRYVEFIWAPMLLGALRSPGFRQDTMTLPGDSGWFSGTRSVRFDVDKVNEPGIRALASVVVVDQKDNRTQFSSSELRELGVDTQFILKNATPDRDAPVLHSFNIPAFIDTSKGPVAWKISGHATDATLPGELLMQFTLDKPLKQAFYTSAYSKPAISAYFDHATFELGGPKLQSGTATSTVWVAAKNGIYNLTNTYVTDIAGNAMHFDAAALRALGITTQVVVSDGTFVAPKLAATVTTDPRTSSDDGAIVLTLSSNTWAASGANEFAATIEYDASLARFKGWQAGSDGAYALEAQTLEVGSSGSTRLTGTIDNKGDSSAFLQLRFTPTKSTGAFTFDLADIRINGTTLLNSLDQSQAYRIATAIEGTAKDDSLTGTGADDYLMGLAGNDVFTSSAGADTLAGDDGLDSAVYSGKRAGYKIARDGQDVLITSMIDPQDSDRLQSVETVAFSDTHLSFDANGSAAHIFRLYKAAFDRVPEASGLGFWMAAANNGLTMHQIASGFVSSKEFLDLHAKDPSHAGIVNSFYLNALDRPADADGTRFWNDLLDRKVLDVAEVLLGFSESPENQGNTAELIGLGMEFVY